MTFIEGTNRKARAIVQNLSTEGGNPSNNLLGIRFRLVEEPFVVDIGHTDYPFGSNETKSIELLFPALRGSGGFAPGGTASSIGVYVYGREQVLNSAAALFDIVIPTLFTAATLSEMQSSATLSQLNVLHDEAVAAYRSGVIPYNEYLAIYDDYLLRNDFLISPAPSTFAKQFLDAITTAPNQATLGAHYGGAVQSRQKNALTYGEFLAIYYTYLAKYYELR